MKNGVLYYRRDGTPCKPGVAGMMEMAKMFESDRTVRRTLLPWGVLVSTVFIALDHQFGDGPPLIFETMVFRTGRSMELACRRYSTEEEAIKGHEEMVKRWKKRKAGRKAR